MLTATEKARLQQAMLPDGKLSPGGHRADGGEDRAARRARSRRGPRRKLPDRRGAGVGPAHPFSGEKLSPVLAVLSRPRLRRRLRDRRGDLWLSGRRALGGHPYAGRNAGAAPRPRAAGVPRHREPGALLRHRRQLRQRAAVLAVDGLRHVGRQQLLRTTSTTATSSTSRASCARIPERVPSRGRDLRRVFRAARAMTARLFPLLPRRGGTRSPQRPHHPARWRGDPSS